MTDELSDAAVPEAATLAAAESAVTPEPAAVTPTATAAAPAPHWSAPTVVAPPPDYSQAGVPSLDFVRDKIEGRYGRSLGSTELAQETPQARSIAEQATQREEAAQQRLAAIRRSLRADPPS